MTYQKNKIKFYVKDAEGRKLFLNDDSNKILNELNGIKRIVSDINKKKIKLGDELKWNGMQYQEKNKKQ